MKVNVLGGGPAGLYAALLLKQGHPGWEIAVTERNPEGATYGWGVVFSDRTLTELREADPETYREITDAFVLWDAIDVNIHDTRVRCDGHTFAGIARRHLLGILARRCAALAVPVHYLSEVDDIDAPRADADLLIAADGVNSKTRAQYADTFKPQTKPGRNRFIWFGTDKVFDSFTFIFRETEHGLFQVHAYPFDGATSTFIVECAEETWQRTGLRATDEDASVAFCESLFADHLNGRHLFSNRSHWLTFLTLRNARWSHENAVLLGDAAHTAHFSIGSGTKLALEDAIALAQAFEKHDDRRTALRVYELSRKPRVEGIQRAASESQRYFENTKRYHHFAPLPFAFNLLTRSGRITYDSLRPRDPRFIADVERWFRFAAVGGGEAESVFRSPAVPPMLFTPLALGGVTLHSRVAAVPMPVYGAADGLPTDCHAAPLTDAAREGAGLVFTEPVAVKADGRITPGDVGLYHAEHAEAWTRIVDAIHEQSPAKIGLTLNHGGRRGATRIRAAGLDCPLHDGNWPVLSASAIPYTPVSQTPKEMECADMEIVCAAFVQAAWWAADAGFDLLQLHMGHGYLLASFLSPLTNRRADEYGGTLENRMRFPLAVFDAVHAAWPEERPLAVALSAMDWVKDGSDLTDAVAVARTLKEHGCDLITVLAGQTVPDAEPRYDFEALAGYSDIIRNEAGIATLATPYMTTSGPANTLLAGGRADLCLMQRLP